MKRCRSSIAEAHLEESGKVSDYEIKSLTRKERIDEDDTGFDD